MRDKGFTAKTDDLSSFSRSGRRKPSLKSQSMISDKCPQTPTYNTDIDVCTCVPTLKY